MTEEDTWTIRVAIHHRDDIPESSFCAVSQVPRNRGGPGLLYFDASTDEVRGLSAAEPGRGGWGPATDVTAAIEAAALRLVEHGR